MRVVFSTLIIVATLCATAWGEPGAAFQVAQANLPTLEEVVFIESALDSNDVYLGEVVTLTLTYGQLDFRGIRVQDYYKSSQLRLPETEGFFAEKPVEEQRTITRDGQQYRLTLHHVRLYPTRTGELFIGSWRWQGTARGYTGGGANSVTIDRRTESLRVMVRPLPPAPADFDGAVGHFEISSSIEETELVQGIPTRLQLQIRGDGNSQAIRAPVLPVMPWYRLSDGRPSLDEPQDAGNGSFQRSFEYEFVPLMDGRFELGPITFTYFSPATKKYETAVAPELSIHVEAAGENERLVVVGGAGPGYSDGMELMGDGRLPLVAETGPLRRDRDWSVQLWTLFAVPVAVYLFFLLVDRLKVRPAINPSQDTPAGRLHQALLAPQAVDRLREAILNEVASVTGLRTIGMTAPELEAALSAGPWGRETAGLCAALKRCELYRYGGKIVEKGELLALAVKAGQALELMARRGVQ